MSKELKDLLALNLQYFAEPTEPVEPSGGVDPESDPVEPTAAEPVNNPDEKTFTQSELDKIIADRLSREQKKRDEAVQKERDEAEKRKLEDQSEYKELYEQAQAEILTAKADALNVRKETLLVQAGYDSEQIVVLKNTVVGETDEELTQAVANLTGVISPKKNYIDPSSMGAGTKPTPTDGEAVGKAMYDRIKHKLRG